MTFAKCIEVLRGLMSAHYAIDTRLTAWPTLPSAAARVQGGWLVRTAQDPFMSAAFGYRSRACFRTEVKARAFSAATKHYQGRADDLRANIQKRMGT